MTRKDALWPRTVLMACVHIGVEEGERDANMWA